MSLTLPEKNFKQFIVDLAEKHDVVYQRTHLDELADTFTSLSGNDVDQDDIERLVIALRRANIITLDEFGPLLHGYLKEQQ